MASKTRLVKADSDRVTHLGPGHVAVECSGLYYYDLNQLLRALTDDGVTHLELRGVQGQRYIGTDLPAVRIGIHGTPGTDLGAFMNGSVIEVHGNGQDGLANTMNDGEIVIYGSGADIAGFAMRGGKLFIRDDAGYRVGIHMKEYQDKIPVLVVGGVAHDFLGEYMAGGILIVLCRDSAQPSVPARFIGTGMHGGVIFLRGKVDEHQLGKEVVALELDDADRKTLRTHVTDFASRFNLDAESLLSGQFTKLLPLSHRPYGKLYAY